jgi:hypothetical protein
MSIVVGIGIGTIIECVEFIVMVVVMVVVVMVVVVVMLGQVPTRTVRLDAVLPHELLRAHNESLEDRAARKLRAASARPPLARHIAHAHSADKRLMHVGVQQILEHTRQHADRHLTAGVRAQLHNSSTG